MISSLLVLIVWDMQNIPMKMIVCAAVSAMTINCINSIETFTETLFYCDTNEADGMISFRITEKNGTDAQLLLKSLILGFENMESNYEEYIDLIFEEV